MKQRTYWAVLLALAASFSACLPAPASQAQFVGVCQASVQPEQADIWNNLSFIRNDLSWGTLQPTGPTDWNARYLEEWGAQVLRNREHGVETLPTLDYMGAHRYSGTESTEWRRSLR